MYHALIRTHHITSRKKVAVLKAAAKKLQCFALLRSGGVPGLMYVQGKSKTAVQSWVDTVHGLRYKDYQLVAPPVSVAVVSSLSSSSLSSPSSTSILGQPGVLQEVDKVKDMATRMMEADDPKLIEWWRRAMGFVC